jgi:ABC-type multidrug transport system fused ATPase/permease subunit
MEFVSVERIVELLRLEQELPGSIDPPASWPTFSGDLVFSNTTLRYAPHLEPALHDLSFTIQGGSTTAIVGRTGSGKSTIALSLLGTLLPSHGTISIDGVDVASVNKQALRSRITFLAQDPVLFPGPLRANLDPLTEHSDAACEHVLARIAPGYGWTLVTPVDAGGRNLSQGQRQLIGLARAILRQSSVVILDEATASVDLDTSYMVQRVLREELKGATVVTIAHRVEAVRGAERYVVLGKGRLVESGKVVDGALVAESKG